MIEKEYWENYYKTAEKLPCSPFAESIIPRLKTEKSLVELGCGNGRDLYFFRQALGMDAKGVDASFENHYIKKQDVSDYIAENPSPDYVYTRFFWHSIDLDLRDKILSWCEGTIFIEARTELDKPKDLFGAHKRIRIEVRKLVDRLSYYGYNIDYLSEGYGYSPFMGEDPHLVRVIATRRK